MFFLAVHIKGRTESSEENDGNGQSTISATEKDRCVWLPENERSWGFPVGRGTSIPIMISVDYHLSHNVDWKWRTVLNAVWTSEISISRLCGRLRELRQLQSQEKAGTSSLIAERKKTKELCSAPLFLSFTCQWNRATSDRGRRWRERERCVAIPRGPFRFRSDG